MKSDNINQCIQTSYLQCLLLHPFSHLPHFYKTNNSNNLIFPINSKQKKQHLHPQVRYLQFFVANIFPPLQFFCKCPFPFFFVCLTVRLVFRPLDPSPTPTPTQPNRQPRRQLIGEKGFGSHRSTTETNQHLARRRFKTRCRVQVGWVV